MDRRNQIVDTFGREHTYLRISLTDLCNLRCFYCMPEEGIQPIQKPQLMQDEEVLSLARTFRDLGVDTVRLTGGEPLVRKNFGALALGLSELGVKLKLTTNGILLDRYFGELEQAGLTRINISLDTLDKAKSVFVTKRDYYDRIMENLREALDRGWQIKLNAVLIRGVNDSEINDFVRLTEKQDLAVKFIEFMPFKGNQWDWNKGISKAEILEEVQAGFGEVEAMENPRHSTSSNYRVKGFRGSFGIVSTITSPFCGECNRIRLTADGKMKNCLFATAETDLLGPLRRGEPVAPLILESITRKKFSRDGMDVHMDADHYEKNRSMISIGG